MARKELSFAQRDTAKDCNPKDYVPLTERAGWKRKVRVIPGPYAPPRPPHNPTLGKK